MTARPIALTCILASLALSLPASAQPQHRYDDQGRLILMINDDGSVVSYSYDATGTRIRNENSDGNSLEFDSQGNAQQQPISN